MSSIAARSHRRTEVRVGAAARQLSLGAAARGPGGGAGRGLPVGLDQKLLVRRLARPTTRLRAELPSRN
jgi:hypothetical protein